MLTAGTKIGPYEVVSSLGQGGMGEVYRARDRKLDRDVALKILPAAFATDPERLARFEREAKTLAVLNHTHIAQIHGLEDASAAGDGGIRALVMELVEGPTLAERIAQGPMPLDEAVQIARQIADALEAAHAAGIIHRDLKPANIKLRPDGVVKVLDFGLAKAVESSTSSHGSRDFSPAVLNSPTLSIAATQAGVILGTAAYMSPEQVRGRRVDQRVDVWAFGCVLFEMLAGRKPFNGESINDLMAAVISEEPEWSALPTTVPTAVRRVIERCLRKDPHQRIHSIADARLDLEEALTRPAAAAPVKQPSRLERFAPWAIAAAALIALAAVVWRGNQPTTAAADPIRFSILPPPGFEIPVTTWPIAAISPDGKQVVIVVSDGGPNRLMVQPLGAFAPTPLPNTVGAYSPAFGPDGNWIMFSADRKLKKISIDGRSIVTICNSDWGGAAWGPDDQIVFTPRYNAGLSRVPAGGGSPQVLTQPDAAKNELGHWWPQFLPDGKTIIYTVFAAPFEKSRIDMLSLDTGARTTLLEGGMFGRFATTGHLLFARGETVMAVRFDPASRRVSGQATPVIDGVAPVTTNGLSQFALSGSGSLTFVPTALGSVRRRLVWIDRKGVAQPVTNAVRAFAMPKLSPDGRRVALAIDQDGKSDVWIYELARGTFARVTSEPANQFYPVWSSDGRTLYYVSEQPLYQIFRRSADLQTPGARMLSGGDGDVLPMSMTSDGKYLIYQRSSNATGSDLVAHPLAGGEPTVLVETSADDSDGLVSSDSRWLAYLSEVDGRTELYVQPFMTPGARTQISTNGASDHAWSRDGQELFFVEGRRKLMSVAIGAGRELDAGKPQLLVDGRFDFGFDVAADGRFIVAQRDPTAPPIPLHVVLNWHSELIAKVP